MYEALRIALQGNVSELTSFAASHADVLSQLGVSEEEARFNLRLLSLCTLAADAERLSFAQVAAALEVEEDQVESWVVAAVSRNLLDARINQLAREVDVHQVQQRAFDEAQWRGLQRKLHAWRDSVGAMLSSLRAARAEQEM